MKPAFLALDSLDDRRELHGLLHRLPPARRLAFLVECCRRVTGSRGNGPKPVPSMWSVSVPEAERCERGNDRLTNAVFADLIALAHQHGLDLVRAARDLEQLVRAAR